MADKKDKASAKSLAKNMLLNHPEVLNSARHLFHNQNGQGIIEDRVPRGDPKREDVGQPFNVYDLKENDLRDLAKYATDIVDEGILRYDERTAYEDALHRAINEKDGGKYAGKVNSNTYALILSNINKNPKLVSKKSYDISDNTQSSNMEGTEMSRSDEIKTLQAKLANLQKQDDMEKVAALVAGMSTEEREQFKVMLKAAAEDKKKGKNQSSNSNWQTTLDAIGIKAKKAAEETKEEKKEEEKKVEEATGKKHDEEEKDHEKKETAEEKKIEGDKKDEKADEKDASVTEELDKIAGELQGTRDFELFKLAYQLDTVSDVLEGKKTASALQSEPDEKYMREAFNSTIIQKDSDEKYMADFATDKTQEVDKAYKSKPYGIVKDKK
jgi:hypothetical protein